MRSYSKQARHSPPGRAQSGLPPHDHALEPGQEPPIGAHIVTPRRGYTHHGIYVGRGHVVQYGGLSGGLHRGPVEEIPLSQFTNGRPIWIRLEGSGRQDRPEVVRRARSRLGEDRYHVLTNNCEHFCEWCVHGQHRSYQVEELLGQRGRIWQRLVKPLAQTLLAINRANVDPPAAAEVRLNPA